MIEIGRTIKVTKVSLMTKSSGQSEFGESIESSD